MKFDFVGGVDRRVALGKPVELGPGRVPGVIGMKAIHLLSREDMKKVPKTDALYLDIGASSREEALSMVPLGTCGAFVGPPERFGDGLFKGKAIDDRVGCAVMLELLREKLPMDVTFAFTVQEEVGTRGPSARPSPSRRRWLWCWRPPPPPTCPWWRTTGRCAPREKAR